MSGSEPLPEAPESFAVRAGHARVVEVLEDDDRVVLNRGSRDGIKVGLRFLVFGHGQEMRDPETGESLGVLEIVRGEGVITHVQEKISTLSSARKSEGIKRKVVRRTPSNFLAYMGTTEEETFEEREPLPFNNPAVGDYARRV